MRIPPDLCLYCGAEVDLVPCRTHPGVRCRDTDACRDRMVRIRETTGYRVTPLGRMLALTVVVDDD